MSIANALNQPMTASGRAVRRKQKQTAKSVTKKTTKIRLNKPPPAIRPGRRKKRQSTSKATDEPTNKVSLRKNKMRSKRKRESFMTVAMTHVPMLFGQYQPDMESQPRSRQQASRIRLESSNPFAFRGREGAITAQPIPTTRTTAPAWLGAPDA